MTSLQLDPPAPPRRSASTSCDLHPGETFTGFCAACLRERLQGLEASAAAASAPGRKSTSAIRSLFARPFGGAGASASGGAAEPPDLRRCKSFSCGRGGDALATAAAARAADEPQRRSCDVRGRSTLWALFHQDDRDRVRDGTAFGAFPASSSAAAAALAADAIPQTQPHCVVPDDFIEEDIPVVMEESDEIIPVVESTVAMDTSGEMMDAEAINAAGPAEGSRPIKEHIDAEAAQAKKASPKDLKEIAGSFWVAASVFSKKWQKWRRKQKLKKEAAVSKAAAAAMPPPEKPPKPSFLLRRRRARGDAAGADLAGGRRSCDTDPRFSLEAARMSVDDAGFSWDEPRASWDGYLFGAGGIGGGVGRAPPPLSRLPPILSVLEDTPAEIIERYDGQIPVEDDADFEPPGGTLQTRDYYLDSSSRRRRSLDRTSSVRRPSFEVGQLERTSSVRRPSFEVGQLERTSSVRRPSFEFGQLERTRPSFEVPEPAMAAANGKESPIGGSEFYHFHHAEDLLDRGFSSNSLIEDISASLEAALSGPAKKPRHRWRTKAWSLWGLIHRRAAGGRRSGGGPADIADRSFSEPWPDLRVRGANPKMQRCNSNLSARSSFSSNSGGLGSSRRSGGGGYVDAGAKRSREQQEQLERARGSAARYSPGRADGNGMLRFYLTPMRSGSLARRGASKQAGPGRPLASSQSFARSVLRMY